MKTDNAVHIYVTYAGSAADRFDRDLYVEHHLPLVMSSWGQYGLLDIRAFFPAGVGFGTVAICECIFRDEVAVQTAFASPETSGVMADVALFTDLVPSQMRATPLRKGWSC